MTIYVMFFFTETACQVAIYLYIGALADLIGSEVKQVQMVFAKGVCYHSNLVEEVHGLWFAKAITFQRFIDIVQ